MISVLIPCYNEDPSPLCQKILEVGRNIDGLEIIVGDDHSQDPVHLSPGLKSVRIQRNPQNLGYNKNRNALARSSVNDKILFLDADVMPGTQDFLEKHLEALDAWPDKIICGGIYYGDKPSQTELHLKWLHGKYREGLNAELRKKNPGRAFHAGNFSSAKQVFLDHPFPEKEKAYGYNDTIYGLILDKKGLLLHIDNPVENLGLMPHKKFLLKAERAAQNLKKMEGDPEFYPFLKEIRLYKAVARLRDSGMDKMALWWLEKRKSRLLKKLHSESPSLRAFDLYRLFLTLQAFQNKES